MLKFRDEFIAVKWGINSTGCYATGVADEPKALPCWLRVNLRKLVEKGAPSLRKGFYLFIYLFIYYELNSEAVFLWAKCG